jgi:hypothetical protein
LRTFLGWLYIGLPHGVALIGLGILSLMVTFLAFWVVLLLGRYPRGFFDFQVGVLQWQWRVGCSLCNLLDGYPSFGLGSDGDPAWIQIPYPERLGRLHLLFRLILGLFYVVIPHGLILSIRFLLSFVLGFLAFWSVLFTGRYPRSFHDFNAGSLRWSFRYNLYLFFLTDTYPPFSGREDVG